MSHIEKFDDHIDVRPSHGSEDWRSGLNYRLKMETRRSVRAFKPTPVPAHIIENAIKAAVSAPSGANLQPWYFAIIRCPKLKKRIRKEAEGIEHSFYTERAPETMLHVLSKFGTGPEKKFLDEAPVLIGIFYCNQNLDCEKAVSPTYYAKESVGIATGLLLSALHLSGLATLTYTPNPMGFLVSCLNLDPRLKPFMMVVAGYPQESAALPDIQKKPFLEVCGTYE